MRMKGRRMPAPTPCRWADSLDADDVSRRAHRRDDLLGEQAARQCVFVGDRSLSHQLAERDLEGLHTVLLTGEQHVAELIGLALADQASCRMRCHKDLEGCHLATADP